MENNNQIQNQHYSSLISPRGTRERLQTKRHQFEQIIQAEKDKNDSILRSMVKPYGK